MADWIEKLIAVLGVTLVYALGSIFYLAFLNPKGELVQYRSRLIGYGTGFMLVFGSSVFFNTELRQVWQIWLGVFVTGAIGIVVWGVASGGRKQVGNITMGDKTDESHRSLASPPPTSSVRRPWRTWQKVGVIWLVMNSIPLWVLEMFHRARTP